MKSKLSNVLDNGDFTGVIRGVSTDDNGRVAIVIDNDDESIGRASWKVWKDDGSINQDGGADAFNSFAVGVLQLEEDLDEDDVKKACDAMSGVHIKYKNQKHFSKKTNKEYNRFTFLELVEREGTLDKDLRSEETTKEIDVVQYALDLASYKHPPKKVNGFFLLPIEGVDLLHRHCNNKGMPENDPIEGWALSPKGIFGWEFNLTLFEAWFKKDWRERYMKNKGWRHWLKLEK